MNTILYTYRFDLTDPVAANAYKKFCDGLKVSGVHKFKAIGGYSDGVYRELDGRTIKLDTTHIFSDQWNTGPIEGISEDGIRVFDWAEEANFSDGKEITSYVCGHYLQQTPEMQEIRRNTYACGYCGHQEQGKSLVFCDNCMDSEYLKLSDLHLLRLLPVEQHDPIRMPLTELENAYLVPLYHNAQLHGSTERGTLKRMKQRIDIVKKATTIIENATIERDGMLWLLNHDLNIDNVIFYSHTSKFCFGWRNALSADTAAALQTLLIDFPYMYDIERQ